MQETPKEAVTVEPEGPGESGSRADRRWALVGRLHGWLWRKVILGTRLEIAASGWIKAALGGRALDPEALGQLGAAVIRRVIRVEILAALTLVVLVWQNVLLHRQISHQMDSEAFLRRSTFVDRLYSFDAGCEPTSARASDYLGPMAQQPCAPLAHARARSEAVRGLLQLEYGAFGLLDRFMGRSRGVNLDRANLQKTNLERLDLRQASLTGASLAYAEMKRVDLSEAFGIGTVFRGADLTQATLEGAMLQMPDFEGARFYHAHARGVQLIDASLQDARLGCVDLRDANVGGTVDARTVMNGAWISGASLQLLQGLSQEHLDATVCDAATRVRKELSKDVCSRNRRSSYTCIDSPIVVDGVPVVIGPAPSDG